MAFISAEVTDRLAKASLAAHCLRQYWLEATTPEAQSELWKKREKRLAERRRIREAIERAREERDASLHLEGDTLILEVGGLIVKITLGESEVTV